MTEIPGQGQEQPPQGPDFELRPEDLEEREQYERSIRRTAERVESTSFPWVVRQLIRDEELRSFNTPYGFDDRYSKMHLYNGMINRAELLSQGSASEGRRKLWEFDQEPWREESVIPRHHIRELRSERGFEDEALVEIVSNAEKRRDALVEELNRSAEEFTTMEKILNIYDFWTQLASGKQVGEIYLRSRPESLPVPKDFKVVFNAPSYIQTEDEVRELPGYPEENTIREALEDMKRKENEPLGEQIDRVLRALYIISISENPNKMQEWINLATQGARERGESEEEAQKAWWKALDLDSENEAKAWIGDPDTWIPIEQRRSGDADKFKHLEDKEERKEDLELSLRALKKARQDLRRPGLTETERADLKKRLEEQLVKIDKLSVTTELKEGKEKKVSVLGSLFIENELGFRGKLTKIGNIWSLPRRASEKDDILEKAILEFVGGDELAVNFAKTFHRLFAIASKYGYYAADYDPEKDEWEDVDVEGWPYTDEFAKIMGFHWYQRYKGQASGPEGSRGRFGPLMPDYLRYTTTFSKDEHGRPEYRIIRRDTGEEDTGTAAEGVVIGDTTVSMFELWAKGASLGELPWQEVVEDPVRVFLLRGFFAEGREGRDLIGKLTKTEWDPEELLSDGFWESFKLDTKVLIKDQLLDEAIWRDIVRSVDREYEEKLRQLRQKLDAATSQKEREKIMRENDPDFASYKNERREVVKSYIYKTWWKGVKTTSSYNKWKSQAQPTGAVGLPKKIVPSIISKAKEHGVVLE